VPEAAVPTPVSPSLCAPPLRADCTRCSSPCGAHPLQKLGLTELGCKLRAEWNEAEEALFALGMLWFRRPNKSVQRRYLPHKTLHQLQVGTLPGASFCRPGLLGRPVQARPTPADVPHPCPTAP
jgi:hypothetical protein